MGFQVNPVICQAPNTAEMCGSLVPTTVQEVASHRLLRLSKQGAVWFADDPNKPAEKSLQVNPEQIILETFREKENPKALFCFRLNEVFHFKLEQLVC
ncbi:hypothetical protein Anapl_00020 [Anas platyrhynchos]|uniref:Uncharacterized protein n=1 Tax=Anas platyrhynchos TaxID=8839 RepID=R0K1H9_ANAPL|nr:hypothetical protein Anapl_00020 [Anas platyrhynchos]